ncbi:MAG: helix-turn-helix domain-containing protein [Muribaculaceae bacterium]|nr:helix-turn-helix domain-containing protein [Muribaculaceae bacterium]
MLHDNLRECRNSLGLSQGQIAKGLGMLQSQYSNYECGKSKPSADILEKLVKQFNININYLLTGEGAMFISPELSKETLQFKIPRNARVLLEVEE